MAMHWFRNVGKPPEDRCIGSGSTRYIDMQAASDVWLLDLANNPSRLTRTVKVSDCDNPAKDDTAAPDMYHSLWK